MGEVFVYYRVAEDRADAVRALVSDMQADLRQRHPGLDARLLRRPEADGGVWTWMETYAWPQCLQGVTREIQSEIEAAARVGGLAALLEGARHGEVFESF